MPYPFRNTSIGIKQTATLSESQQNGPTIKTLHVFSFVEDLSPLHNPTEKNPQTVSETIHSDTDNN